MYTPQINFVFFNYLNVLHVLILIFLCFTSSFLPSTLDFDLSLINDIKSHIIICKTMPNFLCQFSSVKMGAYTAFYDTCKWLLCLIVQTRNMDVCACMWPCTTVTLDTARKKPFNLSHLLWVLYSHRFQHCRHNSLIQLTHLQIPPVHKYSNNPFLPGAKQPNIFPSQDKYMVVWSLLPRQDHQKNGDTAHTVMGQT